MCGVQHCPKCEEAKRKRREEAEKLRQQNNS